MKKLVVIAVVLISVLAATVPASAQWIRYYQKMWTNIGKIVKYYYLDTIFGRQNDGIVVRRLDVYEFPTRRGCKAFIQTMLINCRQRRWRALNNICIGQGGNFMFSDRGSRWYGPNEYRGATHIEKLVPIVCSPGFGRKPYNPRANKWPW